MDHGHSGGSMPMPDMPDMKMCSMNMLWNNDIEDVCVVFSSWHITGPLTMLLSCLAVAAVAIFYSFILHQISRNDRQIAYSIVSDSNPANRRESVVASRRESLIPPNPQGYSSIENGAARVGVTKLSFQSRITRAGLYAFSVAISFWLMLVAMTYNTFLLGSIIVGAFLGHILYEGSMDVGSVLSGSGGKGLACH